MMEQGKFHDEMIERTAALQTGQIHITEVLSEIREDIKSMSTRITDNEKGIAAQKNALAVHESGCVLRDRMAMVEAGMKYVKSFRKLAWWVIGVMSLLALTHAKELLSYLK